ncbi:hypothetical protein T265_02104 [Opisthorchis viverrini]|uniref:Uncharacterized protein n=1 Tax=Opisthorchis viverrini TaxID=6198 RepID=A0A075AIJ4_OPIVI|nr:hypothetical protein T265_02104 [Opisthorchis viverrini]KER31739.1 hypothetical protein T265_02104 [Opisthorchis viverrini]
MHSFHQPNGQDNATQSRLEQAAARHKHVINKAIAIRVAWEDRDSVYELRRADNVEDEDVSQPYEENGGVPSWRSSRFRRSEACGDNWPSSAGRSTRRDSRDNRRPTLVKNSAVNPTAFNLQFSSQHALPYRYVWMCSVIGYSPLKYLNCNQLSWVAKL